MPESTPDERPLQGWKEIAAYLDRDMRTAIRWEKEEGLPIRRHRLKGRSSVYAYVSEIEDWRTARPTHAEAQPAPEPLWRRPAAWAAAALAAIAVAFVLYGPILNPRDPVAEAADDSMRSEQVWTDRAASRMARLSPDGKMISYVGAANELWVRHVSTGESRLLTRSGEWDNLETSAISPDGGRVASAWFNGEALKYELRLTDFAEGDGNSNERVLYRPGPDDGGYLEVLGWLSDSRVLFVKAKNGEIRFLIIDAKTDDLTPLKTLAWQYPIEPILSRDGRWVAYAAPREPTETANDIFVLATDGSSERMLVEHPAEDLPVGWTPDGSHLLFRSDRTGSQSLWALPFSEGKTAGPPKMLSSELSAVRTVGVSPQGDFYYLKRTGFKEVRQGRLDLTTGRVIAVPKPVATSFVGDNYDPIYSPDGSRMAYLSNRSLQDFTPVSSTIVVRDLASGAEHEIDPETKGVSNLSWSPDSASLLFRSRNAGGAWGAYRVAANGGESEPLFFPDVAVSSKGRFKNAKNFGWMRDGRSIHYREGYGGGGAHWIHDLESGERRALLPPGSNYFLTLSSDGFKFAMTELRHQRTDHVAHVISTLDVKTGERKELAYWPRPEGSSYSAPTQAAWSPERNKLVVWKIIPPQNKAAKSLDADLWIIDVDSGEAHPTELSVQGLTKPLNVLSLHPDGERLTFSAGQREYEIWKLSNFLDRLEASDD